MSDFESNPFADPEAGLGGRDEKKKTTEELIDDFNPFAVDQFANQPAAASQPAIMRPSTSIEQPPPYTAASSISAPVASSSATQSVTDDLQRRQEELDRKAAEIERREKEMNQNIIASSRTNNFPPLPSWFPIKPCFYQDFNLDIPTEFQKIVRAHFYLWISYSLLLLVNVGGALGSLVTSSTNQCGTTFGLSILYFILFTPCAFACWYRPVYKAFRLDSSFNFFFYFFVFIIQFGANIIQAIGIDGSGTCGFFNGITSATKVNVAVGVIMIIIGSLFASCAVIAMILLIRVHRIYRSSGASFSKAQQEFAQGVVRNRTVQQTATSVASEAARSAAEQTFTDVRH